MANDIVTRLRDTAYETDVCWEAAAEIERLREEVKHWHERAYLHAPHVVKQAWVAEADND